MHILDRRQHEICRHPTSKSGQLSASFFFAALTFLITWSTGTAVVLSTHAELVNGAHRIQHPIPLPFPIAILFVVIGGWAPGLATLVMSAFESGRPGIRELLRQFRCGEFIPCGTRLLF
jgi:hypothetical protein